MQAAEAMVRGKRTTRAADPAPVIRKARRGKASVDPEALRDPLEAAKAAGLRYVSDTGLGIRRKKAGKYFSYVSRDGTPVRDRETLARIRSLAIPPAWTEVWICPRADGHLQATGRDAKGRKQYRYHARWRQVRDETKYQHAIAFAQALPQIRERVERDMARPGLPREKVLATVVRLLETTLVRVGNEEYAKQNRSYGLTTLRDRHVDVEGSMLHFQFKGKSGKQHRIDVRDRRLARIVAKCQAVPGQELFQYVDETGERRSVGSEEVNAYLREITGQDFTAKDFRTWAGTVLAAIALQEIGVFGSQAQAKKNVVQAIERVSERLGNTPSVCRKCYVHPAVLDSYLDGTMLETLQQRGEEMEGELGSLQPEEAAVLGLLQRRLELELGEADANQRETGKRRAKVA